MREGCSSPQSMHSLMERQKCVACIFFRTGLFKHIQWGNFPGAYGVPVSVVDPGCPKMNQLLNWRSMGPELLIM